jgi:hypothetical protein
MLPGRVREVLPLCHDLGAAAPHVAAYMTTTAGNTHLDGFDAGAAVGRPGRSLRCTHRRCRGPVSRWLAGDCRRGPGRRRAGRACCYGGRRRPGQVPPRVQPRAQETHAPSMARRNLHKRRASSGVRTVNGRRRSSRPTQGTRRSDAPFADGARGPATSPSAATCRTSRPRTSGSGSNGGIRASRRRPTTTASCSASLPGPLRNTHSSRSTTAPRPLHHGPPSRRSSPSRPGSQRPIQDVHRHLHG